VLTTSDETQRQALYRDILTRLHNDAVYLPISYLDDGGGEARTGAIPYAPVTAEIPFEQIQPVKP
jgi:nickel transport system substrate-binding protein